MKKSAFICAICGLSLLPGCATVPSIQTALNSTSARLIESAIVPIVSEYAATGKVNEADAINAGLQSIAALAPATLQTSGTPELESLIANTVVAFTGDKSASGKSVGQRIASAVVDAVASQPNPSPAQVTNAVVQAGVLASTAATQTKPQTSAAE